MRASNGEPDSLALELDELWHRRIVREQHGDSFDFSHGKIREVVYAGMSLIKRRLLHRRVAQALEEINAWNLDAVSSQLAIHYEWANMPDRAVTFYYQAAKMSQRVYAHAAAGSLLLKGLELLGSTPATTDHIRQEVELLALLGPTLMVTKGYASPEVEECVKRTVELYRSMGRTPQLFDAQSGIWGGFLVRGQLQKPLILRSSCTTRLCRWETHFGS